MQLIYFSPERIALLANLSLQTRLCGHEIIARRLKASGLTHIYWISGSPPPSAPGCHGR